MTNPSLLAKIAEAFDTAARRFEAENARLADLAKIRKTFISAPPHDLGQKIWVDFEPDTGVEATALPGGAAGGLSLEVASMGSSRWFSLSYALDLDTLRAGRYLAVLAAMDSPGFVSYRPCLRLVGGAEGGGFTDLFARDYVVSSGGPDEQLSFIRIDRSLAAAAAGAEMHLFFNGSAFTAHLRSVENLLIV